MDSITGNLYLELLKRSLTYAMWDEPALPLDAIVDKHLHGRLRRFMYFQVVRPFLQRRNMILCKTDLKILARKAHTMLSPGLLGSLQNCVETAIKEKIPGDLIETGVWRGGASMLMKGVLDVHDVHDRRLFLADSFEGLPAPNLEKYPADSGAEYHLWSFLAIPMEEVRSSFEKFGLLDQNVVFVKGWFKDTLPTLPTQALAVMRLDGDLYESTMDALVNLYPKLSIGGFCIIDDWCLPACQRAVKDYRKLHGIKDQVVNPGFDDSGVFWRKGR